MVQVGTSSSTGRYIKTNYPITEGLILGSTKIDGRVAHLVPEESSIVLSNDKVGLY